MIEHVTLHAAFDVLRWSILACKAGLWPLLDHDNEPFEAGSRWDVLKGTPLAGGYKLLLWLFEGDWKYQKETFRLRAYVHTEMCHLCTMRLQKPPY